MAQRSGARGPSSALLHGLTALCAIAAAYFGRDLLLPLVVSAILSLVLSPIVDRLERIGLPNGLSVLGVVVVVMASVVGLGYMVTTQGADLLDSLPKYRNNIDHRIQSILRTDSGVIGRTAEMVEDIRREAEASDPATDGSGPSPLDPFRGGPVPGPVSGGVNRFESARSAQGPPVAVYVLEVDPSPFAAVRGMVGPLLKPVASAGIVFVFLVFFLLSRRDLKDRLMQLAGHGHVQVTATAVDEAGDRISRYLLAHVTLNLIYGLSVGLMLWAVGLPGAALWGLLAALLRFVPYVGPWLSALMPLALSLAVFEDWSRPATIAGTFLVLELISNNVLEPWLYGSKTGLSTIAVLLATLFWGWLWGPLGIVLAVPMTVVFVVLGRYVPQLAAFSILFGDERSLPDGTRFHHRVLARDEEGAMQLVRTHVDRGGLMRLADEILVPAAAAEKRDRTRGALSSEQSEAYWDLLEDVAVRNIAQSTAVSGELAAASTWCVPISDDAEELNARLLAALLSESGEAAEVKSLEDLESGDGAPARIVLLACAPLEQGTLRRALRVASRRALVHVHLAGPPFGEPYRERLQRFGAARVVERLVDLVLAPALGDDESRGTPDGDARDDARKEGVPAHAG